MEFMSRPPFEPMEIPIPRDLLEIFEKDLRVVIKYPWIVGIPVPPELLKRIDVISQVAEYEVMLVPKEIGQFGR